MNDKHIIRYIHKTYQVSAQTNFCEIHRYNNTKKGHQCNQSISEYIQVWEISRMPNQSEFEPPAHMLTQSFNVREYIALWRETIYVQQQQRNTLYDTVGCLILKLCSKPRWPKQLRRSQIHRKKTTPQPATVDANNKNSLTAHVARDWITLCYCNIYWNSEAFHRTTLNWSIYEKALN